MKEDGIYIKPFYMKLVPLHNSKRPQKFWISNNEIRQYFGDNIALYYNFIEFYTIWLSVPALFGFISYYYRSFIFKVEAYDNWYGLILILWGNLFFIFWKRKENTLKTEF